MTATASRPVARPPSRPAARPASAIPGPCGHPLLGMARALRSDLLGTLQAGFDRYGDVVAYRVGPARGPRRPQRLVVAVHHPDDVRRVFADTEAFTRRTATYRALGELFGMSISTAEGDDWQRQKRLLQPLFTRAAASRYMAIVEQEARAIVEPLRRGGVTTVDALRMTERYALRVLSRTLFADERGLDEETTAALAELVPVVSRMLPARARQVLRPPLRWPTPRNRRFLQTRAALHATVEHVLSRRRHAGSDAAADLVSQLREARDPEGERPLSHEEVRDQALMFLLAGYTTTSSALCSTLQLLGRHPDVQEQVADGGEKIARATVEEGLRLYPPAYALGRRVGPEGGELAGYTLPPGAGVLVSPWITHRHPRVWPDPERFDPWRFAGGRERPPYAWIPFGGGARACIGRHMSLLESRCFVQTLLAHCRIESLDASLSMDQLSTMRPSKPVRIRCRPR